MNASMSSVRRGMVVRAAAGRDNGVMGNWSQERISRKDGRHENVMDKVRDVETNSKSHQEALKSENDTTADLQNTLSKTLVTTDNYQMDDEINSSKLGDAKTSDPVSNIRISGAKLNNQNDRQSQG